VQKDNSTFLEKAKLRSAALRELTEPPVIMETHGGFGALYLRCYREVHTGVVFETENAKADYLARQRPTWAVYQADAEIAIASGAGAHLEANFVDLDPYGSCWPAVHAFFKSIRPRAQRLVMVANDGLRQKIRLGGAWDVACLRGAVERYGNAAIHDKYLEICQELLAEFSAPVGYQIVKWTAYHTGSGGQMSHWAAVLER